VKKSSSSSSSNRPLALNFGDFFTWKREEVGRRGKGRRRNEGREIVVMSINLPPLALVMCGLSHLWTIFLAANGLGQERGRSISKYGNPTYWLLDG